MSGNLLPLFVKVQCKSANMLTWSQLKENTAEYGQIPTLDFFALPYQKVNLLAVESFAVGPVIITDFDSSTMTATDSFNRIRTHEYENIPADGFSGNAELMR